MGALAQAVELQVHADPQLGEPPDERGVGGEADAVGVEGHRPDRLGPAELDDLDDLRMDGRLAAAEHDHLGLALAGDEDVEHAVDLLEAQRVAVGLVAGVGEADRAVEVAVGVDLDDPEAGVLLVLRAEAAVERAAVDDLGLELERDGARPVEAHRVEVHPGVAVDERLELAVLAAALAQVHPVVADVHLRVDHRLAHRADAPGELDEDLVAVDLDHRPSLARGDGAMAVCHGSVVTARNRVLRTFRSCRGPPSAPADPGGVAPTEELP